MTVAVARARYKDELHLSPEQLKDICHAFVGELRNGLREDSSLLMIPTMVDLLPDGHQSGEYFAIDFGGTTLRLLYTQLSAEPKSVDAYEVQQEAIPDRMRDCHVDAIFDYIVAQLIDFSERISQSIREKSQLVVGFCFSFPVEQSAINAGTLIRWTKGYKITGAEGQNPVDILKQAFTRQGLKPIIPALVNDTVATLAGTRYADGQDTNVAVIMGTGTNACYVEQLGHISKWLPKFLPRTPDMVVNIEWAGFRPQAVRLLPEDEELDAQSQDPGSGPFEKLTGGLYLGDLARRLMLRVGREEGWFPKDQPPQPLTEYKGWATRDMVACVHDESSDLQQTQKILNERLGSMGAWQQLDVRRQVRDICVSVAKRSARLVAAALSGLLLHLERAGPRGQPARPSNEDDEHPRHTNLNPQDAPSTGALHEGGVPMPTQEMLPPAEGGEVPRNVLAADGRLFEQFRAYRELLRDGIADTLGEEVAAGLVLKVTEGGAAFGAACVAAAAHAYVQTMGRDLPSSRTPGRSRTVSKE
ncbi:hypothetical protein WJX73_003720 [Symbiochloris irregularis]|uniref:Phosphotransferase n=1 Tax=Symbiochloris irregularis TaxID=706552 RepID=A0AAW1P5Q4_9CHLO